MADRFVLFNPAGETDHVLGFNPVHPDTDQLDYLLDSLISACLKAWGQDDTDRTPRITKWLENIFYTIMCNDLTLVETAPMLSIHNKEHRAVLLRNVHNDLVLDDWRMFEVSSNTQKQALIEGAANRLRKFLRNEHIRNIVGQRDRVLDFGQAMDEGKIVLINLNGQGIISQENMRLLGVLIVNEVFRCAKLREFRDRRLKPFYFYIDEFAQFVTRDIARTLEEARKFKLFMVLAHQHLAQLRKEDEYLYASVLTNCRNKVVFGGLSREDAAVMAEEVSTGFVNLKSVKDEIYSTKSRQRLEKRTVRSWSEGTSESQSTGQTTGETVSEGRTRSMNKSRGESQSETATATTGSASARGHSSTSGEAYTDSETISDSESHSVSQSQTTAPSRNNSEALARRIFGQAPAPTGWSEQVSQSQGRSRSLGQSNTRSNSITDSQTQTESRSQSEGQSSSRTQTESVGKSQSSTSSATTSKSESKSQGSSRNQGEAETWVAVHDEYQELSSRTFWSLAELEYMETAAIKNQGTAEAFIKLRDDEPKRVKIKHVENAHYHPSTSPPRLERFRNKAIAANAQCYTPIEQAQAERQQRQIAAFGEPLRLDGQLIEGEAEDLIEPAADDPFN